MREIDATTPVEAVQRAVADGAFPGAVAMASQAGRLLLSQAAGRLSVTTQAAIGTGTIYDLASVTKTFTSVAVLALMEKNLVGLEDPIGRFLPHLPEDKRSISVRQLLVHTGGLPRGQGLHRLHPTAERLREALGQVPLLAPPGSRVAYSSIGYLYLGWMIEAVTSTTLDRYFEEAIFRPCGLAETGFRPPDSLRERIAPTEYAEAFGAFVHGEVHDEKAQILGGVTGHAGLFAPAADVLAFGEALVDPGHPVLGEARKLLFEELTGGLAPRRSPAFVINDPVFAFADSTVYSHTGFTGTSLCLVPAHQVVAVLLSNRVNPGRDNERITGARTAFHRALFGGGER